MKKIYVLVLAMIIASGVVNSFADVFPESADYTQRAEGRESIVLYDAVGNPKNIPLDHTPPTIHSITYSGINYVIDIEDTESKLWKVEDDNGCEIIAADTTRTTVTRAMEGVAYVRAYDHANNVVEVTLEKVLPVVNSITYSGEYYMVDVSDPGDSNGTGSGIWKVEDNNGLLTKVRDGLYSGRMVDGNTSCGVTQITVYDRADNRITAALEDISPTVTAASGVTYDQGNYIITVSDSGEDAGTGSGIWTITDSNGTHDVINPGVIRRKKNLEPEVVHIYDRANNESTLQISQLSRPHMTEVYKHEGETYVKLGVEDNVIDLWKIVQVVNGQEVEEIVIEGRVKSKIVCFNLLSESNKIIRVYNHAGNYTEIDLARYETSNYRREYDYTQKAEGRESMILYDAVGNTRNIPLDHTAPTIHGITYSGINYVIDIEDTESKLWKVEDDNGCEIIAADTTRTTVTRAMEGVAYVRAYDHANNFVEVTLEKVLPVVNSITYDGDYYIVNASDPGDNNGTGSGIWKIVDDNGLLTKVGDGLYKGRMVDGNISCGVTEITVYDRANNMVTGFTLEKIPPVVNSITYSGEYYMVDVSDPGDNNGTGSGIWKVEDDNGLLTKVRDGLYRGRMVNGNTSCGVTQITVYDKANNTVTAALEDISPTVTAEEGVTYDQGNYIITVSDSGEDTGIGSGIWTITDSNGTHDVINPGVIRRKKNEEPEVVHIYDRANNESILQISQLSYPYITEVYKYVGETYVELGVKDDVIDLWKMVQVIDGQEVEEILLESKSQKVCFNLLSEDDKIIRVYNHAGNYTEIDLAKYESTKYKREYDYTQKTEGRESMILYDAVGNTSNIPLDHTPPTIHGITYSGTNYMIDVEDTESGLWKVEDANGCTMINPGQTRSTITREMDGVGYITVYDHANNKTSISTSIPVVESLTKTASNMNIRLRATDNRVDLWKVALTPHIRSEAIALLSGRDDTVEFTLPTNDIRKIYVYNISGNCVEVDLSEYEDTQGPAVPDISYKEGNFVLHVQDRGIGVSKVVYNNTTYTTCDGMVMIPKLHGVNTAYVYDDLGNVREVNISGSVPRVTMSVGDYRTNMVIRVEDDVDLWKVTESVGGSGTVFLSGRSDKFTPVTNAGTIYIYNHAGNYTMVDLTRYEKDKFFQEREYVITGDYEYDENQGSFVAKGTFDEWMKEYGGFRIYDAVGNYVEYPPRETVVPNTSGDVWRNTQSSMFKLTVEDAGGLSKITKTNGDDTLDDMSEAKEGTLIKRLVGTNSTTNFTTDVGTNAFNIYDLAHNKLVVSQFSLDEDAPEVTKLPGNNISIRDEESGIWKIEADGGVMLKEYSDSFPSTCQFEVPLGYDRIHVYDGVGNVVTIYMRKEINSNTTISVSETSGIKITGNCTITLDNTSDITIGNGINLYPGIEVAQNVTATINLVGTGMVNVYGGRSVDEYSSQIHYAGIHVPIGSAVNITGTGEIHAYGNGYGVADACGTGAGIGGNGIVVANANTSTTSSNAGSVNIAGAVVWAEGGHYSGNVRGSGAGIGGGGIYNTVLDEVEGGNITYVSITANAQVSAKGGYSTSRDAQDKVYGSGAGIGGGGVYNMYATSISGGNINMCSITGRKIETVGGCAINEAYGTGAGIGGGGVYSTVASIIEGGGVASVSVVGGVTRAYGGYATTSYGSGAGIGGGGVAVDVESRITKGEVGSISIANENMVIATKGYKVIAYGLGEDIGYGGAYELGGDSAEYRKTCVVTRAYKLGTNALVDARDVGNGLCEVTETIGGEARTTFTANNQVVKFTLSDDSIDNVYIYDRYGNYEKVALEPTDAIKLKVRKGHRGSQFVLEAQDTEVGLWKITGENSNDVIRDYGECNYPKDKMMCAIPDTYDTVNVYNTLGNSKTIVLSQDYDPPVVESIIGVGYGMIELVVTDESGVETVKMYKGNEEEPEDEITLDDTPLDCEVYIPDDITRVVITDVFDNDVSVEIGNVPQVMDMYRMIGDDIKLTIAGIERMYYEDNGVEEDIDISDGDGTYVITVPSEVTKLHVVDEDEVDRVLDLERIASRITKAMISSDAIKMLTKVSSIREIGGIEYLDENDVVTGSNVMASEEYELMGVREIPDDTVAFRVVYASGKKCKVDMNNDDSLPQSSNVYITGEGKIAVTLDDPSGVSKVEWYDDNGERHEIDILDNPETTSLEMEGDVKRILVYDTFEDVKAMELNPILTVKVGTMSVNKARLDMTSKKNIVELRYEDNQGGDKVIELAPGTKEYTGVINDIGSKGKITVVYEGESSDVVTLKIDKPSEIESAYIENDKVVMSVADATGVSEVTYGVGENDKIEFVTPLINAVIRVPSSTASVSVKDALGNVETIMLQGLMRIDNMYIRDGYTSIDVHNISRVYYVNEQGNDENIAIVGGKIKVGEGIERIHLVDNRMKDIEVEIPQGMATVGRATVTIDGMKAVVDVGGAKEVSSKEVSDIRGVMLGSSIQDGVITVSEGGITNAVVTYTDGSSNTIVLDIKTPTSVGNIYRSGVDNGINIGVGSNAGIDYVKYYLMGEEETIEVGNLIEAQIRVPNGTSNVIVVDGLGGEKEVDITGGVPMISNIYRNENGDVVISTDRSEVYYEDESGEIELVVTNGLVIVPDGVERIYTKGENEIEVELSDVGLVVNKATVDVNHSRLSLNVVAREKIKKIVFYDSSSKIGEEIEGNTNSINCEMDVDSRIHHIGIVYGEDDVEIIVKLVADNEVSSVSNMLGMNDGSVIVTIEDSAGISKLTYEDEYGEKYNVVYDGSMRVTQKITVDMMNVKVEDRFGTETVLELDEAVKIGDVYAATVSRDGNNAVLNMSSSKEIRRIWYVDRTGKRHNINVDDYSYNDVIYVNGAGEVVVMYEDESISIIELEEDNTLPRISNIRREYMILKMSIADESGFTKIMDDNNRIIKTFEATQDREQNLTLNIAKDATRIYVYDRLGNVAEVILSEYPLVDNVYRNKNGDVCVNTEGISSMYYVDARGNVVEVSRNVDGSISIPEGVDKMYLVSNEGEEIEIELPNDRIDKAVVKEEEDGAKIVIDVGDRVVTRIICYGERGREIGRLEGNDINLDGVMNVPKGTKDVRIVYEDGTSNVVELEILEMTECSDAYQSQRDGTVSMRMRNESGISTLQYTIDNNDCEIELSGDREIIVDIPSGASGIKVIDRFGEIKDVSIPNELPVIVDVHKNSKGEVVITTTETLYYGNDVLVGEDSSGRKIVPNGVDSVYTKGGEGRGVTIEVGDVDIEVISAAIKGKRVAINVSSKKDIARIAYEGGSVVLEEGVKNIKQVLENVPEETEFIEIEYRGEQEGNIHKKTRVLLERDVLGPVVYNTILLEDGRIQVTIEDRAGVKEIQYGEEGVISLSNNGTKVVEEFSVPDGVDSVTIVDMFGENVELSIDESAMDTKIESCARGSDGNFAMVEFRVEERKEGIARVSYVDRRGEKHTEVLEEGTSSYRRLLNINGADEIEIEYQDGTKSVVGVGVDSDGPAKIKTARNGQGRYSVMLEDRRGISRVSLGEETIEIPNIPNRVVVNVDTKKYSAMSEEETNLSMYVNGEEVIVSASPSSVTDKVLVCDGVGNVSNINTRSIDAVTEADTDGPICSIHYANGRYVLHIEDVSGIGSVVGKETGEVIHIIEGLPTEWTSKASVNPVIEVNGEDVEERTLVVRDGVGNETEIALQVCDGVGAREVWKYERDGRIHLKLVDSVGIEKVMLGNSHVLAEYDNNPLEVELDFERLGEGYAVVTDVFGQENSIPLHDVTLTVEGAYRNAVGDKIAVKMRNNELGISKIAYSDGRIIDADVEEGRREIYDVDEGTIAVRVYYDDNVYAIVPLEEDVTGAEIVANENGGKFYRGNGYVVIRAVDTKAGVDSFVVGGNVSYGSGEDCDMKRLQLVGANTIVVRDGLGNETSIDIGDIEEDSDVPQANIRYVRDDNRYEIDMSDAKGGLWKIVRNSNEELVDYTDDMYPEEASLVLDDIRGVKSLEVYDSLGNVMEINLDDVLCIVRYIYKNRNDNKLAINVEDIRGVKKVAIEKNDREKVIERYSTPPNKVCKCYNTPEGLDAVRIYSGNNKMMRWDDVETYEVPLTVDGSSVYSLVGIRTLEYADGVVVEFKQDMPTCVDVDLVNHNNVLVSDALDNSVVMKR